MMSYDEIQDEMRKRSVGERERGREEREEERRGT
jgi:hypothetical protein